MHGRFSAYFRFYFLIHLAEMCNRFTVQLKANGLITQRHMVNRDALLSIKWTCPLQSLNCDRSTICPLSLDLMIGQGSSNTDSRSVSLGTCPISYL